MWHCTVVWTFCQQMWRKKPWKHWLDEMYTFSSLEDKLCNRTRASGLWNRHMQCALLAMRKQHCTSQLTRGKNCQKEVSNLSIIAFHNYDFHRWYLCFLHTCVMSVFFHHCVYKRLYNGHTWYCQSQAEREIRLSD